MLKKMVKIIAIVITIFVLSLVVVYGVLNNSVVVSGRCVKYVNDYNEFYYNKEEKVIRPLLSFGGGGVPGYKISFLPGQKEKLLIKIKQDVNKELTDMVANNSDFFQSYKISDDFKKVYIYYKDAWSRNLNPKSAQRAEDLATELSQETVAVKVELYNEFVYGYENSSFSENIIEFVEVEQTHP